VHSQVLRKCGFFDGKATWMIALLFTPTVKMLWRLL
jgi:hypothetical protein